MTCLGFRLGNLQREAAVRGNARQCAAQHSGFCRALGNALLKAGQGSKPGDEAVSDLCCSDPGGLKAVHQRCPEPPHTGSWHIHLHSSARSFAMTIKRIAALIPVAAACTWLSGLFTAPAEIAGRRAVTTVNRSPHRARASEGAARRGSLRPCTATLSHSLLQARRVCTFGHPPGLPADSCAQKDGLPVRAHSTDGNNEPPARYKRVLTCAQARHGAGASGGDSLEGGLDGNDGPLLRRCGSVLGGWRHSPVGCGRSQSAKARRSATSDGDAMPPLRHNA